MVVEGFSPNATNLKDKLALTLLGKLERASSHLIKNAQRRLSLLENSNDW